MVLPMRTETNFPPDVPPQWKPWLKRLRCVPRILAVQNRRFGGQLDRHELADLAQDVFLVVWRKLSDFQPGTAVESWVYRICYLELMNALRKRSRRQRALDEVARRADEEDELIVPRQRMGDYEDLHRGFETLDPQEAEILRRKHFQEETFEEIARELEIPMGTAKTRYYRGLTKLREFLRNHEEGSFVEPVARA